jgi:hypothetical protein
VARSAFSVAGPGPVRRHHGATSEPIRHRVHQANRGQEGRAAAEEVALAGDPPDQLEATVLVRAPGGELRQIIENLARASEDLLEVDVASGSVIGVGNQFGVGRIVSPAPWQRVCPA